MPGRFGQLARDIASAELTCRFGVVTGLHGLAIEAAGPKSRVGELCAIIPDQEAIPLLSGWLRAGMGALPGSAGCQAEATRPILAEIVGLRGDRVTLMPYGGTAGLAPGYLVATLGDHSGIGVGDALLGRVLDGFGRPLDGAPAPSTDSMRPIRPAPTNPMRRPRIDTVLETGIRAIDALLTLGRGQRVGIFAGSGVGKSTLLGMIARHAAAEVNVIALIGERGREVREFIDNQLGEAGLRRSVVIVATADQPALARIRAAHAAVTIAESFRDQGKHVLLTMDSVTRFAMARREVALSAGEPPTARGYTPSVFAELPELCERCGTAASGGSITALFTVLVEGDDLNEPISDALRAILDGHIVLSRQVAGQGRYPAIDVLKSISRLLPDLTTAGERALIQETLGIVALLERNRQLVELGAYERGSNPELDAALTHESRLHDWFGQAQGGVPRGEALRLLGEWRQALRAADKPVETRADSKPAKRTDQGAALRPRTKGEAA
jgi:flagellum-specific ATP synthase